MMSTKFRTDQSPETNSTRTDQEQETYISTTALKWMTGTLLVYFGLRLLYFALNISSFVPPDEVTHAGVCKAFAHVFLFPDNSPSTYEFGLVTNIPWLYYWTMGKLLHLNFFGISDLVFLRLLNIPLAFGTVYFVRQTLLLLTRDRLTHLLLLVVMTNTAMFTLLSASVSYDNLTNLLAAMSIYYLMLFFTRGEAGALYATAICQLAGCLTKITFLPLVLVLNVLLVMYLLSGFRTFPAALKQHFRESGRHFWMWAAMLLLVLGLNLQLYGGNYLRYGTINPPMATVLTPEKSMSYRLDARGNIFNDFKDGKISYMDALILAGEIKHPGDKADTFFLLMNYQKMKSNPQLWMGPLAYARVWVENMVATIFGIKAHLIMVKEARYLMPLYVLIALSILGFLIRWRPRKEGLLPPALLAIICFYAGYLAYTINYEAYRNYGAPGLTLYGRYLFPLLSPFCALICHYLLSLFRSGTIRLALTIAASLLFIAYDFPWFLVHTTPEWLEWMPR